MSRNGVVKEVAPGKKTEFHFSGRKKYNRAKHQSEQFSGVNVELITTVFHKKTTA